MLSILTPKVHHVGPFARASRKLMYVTENVMHENFCGNRFRKFVHTGVKMKRVRCTSLDESYQFI